MIQDECPAATDALRKRAERQQAGAPSGRCQQHAQHLPPLQAGEEIARRGPADRSSRCFGSDLLLHLGPEQILAVDVNAPERREPDGGERDSHERPSSQGRPEQFERPPCPLLPGQPGPAPRLSLDAELPADYQDQQRRERTRREANTPTGHRTQSGEVDLELPPGHDVGTDGHSEPRAEHAGSVEDRQRPSAGSLREHFRHQRGRDRPFSPDSHRDQEPEAHQVPPFGREGRDEGERRISRNRQDQRLDPPNSIAQDPERHAAGRSAQEERSESDVVEVGQPSCPLRGVETIHSRQQVGHGLVHARYVDLAFERIEDPSERGDHQHCPLVPGNPVVPRLAAVPFSAHGSRRPILY